MSESKSVILTLPTELMQAVEAQAFVGGQSVEEFLAAHVAATRDLLGADLAAAIFVPAHEAKEIRRLFGGKINTAAKLLDMIRRLLGYKIGSIPLGLTPNRQEAINWYAKSLQIPTERALEQIMDQALGLRLKC